MGSYPDGDSPYGAGDTVGQVWEWCSSKYADYPYIRDDGREALEGDGPRILRSGSWWNDNLAAVCRCGFRNGLNPWNWYSNWGFRCARTLSS